MGNRGYRMRARVRWTAAEDAIVREHHTRGARCAEIAALLPGRTVDAVNDRVRVALRLPSHKAPNWTADDDARIPELLERHWSYARIARKFGRTEHAVRARCELLGVSATSANGRAVAQVAKLLGVDSHTVGRWCDQHWLRAYDTGCMMHRGPIRVVEHEDLLAFLEDGAHWHLWQPARIRDSALREWAEELRAGVCYLTAAEVGDRLGLTHYRVNQLINDGKIKAVKYGPNWLVRESDCVYPVGGLHHRHGPAATAQEVDYIHDCWGREPAVRIAQTLGRSDAFVHKNARRLGLPRLGRLGRAAYERRAASNDMRSD